LRLPTDYPFARYLAAKRSVDDRALNRRVWDGLARALPTAALGSPLRVLEVGAGIGTMLERILEWGLLRGPADYTAIDLEADNIAEAHRRLPARAAELGFSAEEDGAHLALGRGGLRVAVELEAIDLFDFVARERGRRAWDVLIAHAFLDLLDIPPALPALFSLIRPGGLFYFTITFDGVTILEPPLDPLLDAQIETLYHRTMDERLVNGSPSGDSRAGRHLFAHLRAAGTQLLDAGSSDWVVFPGPDGYPADEAYFLHFIIHTIDGALRGHPGLDADRFAAWIAHRHAQVERRELVYIAHQMDFLGRAPGG